MNTRPARKGPPNNEGGWENLALAALFLLLAAALILWATGEISALLSSGQRPGAAFGDMGEVLVRLFRNLDNPGRSWPRSVRRLLPGPVLFYLVLVILAAAFGLASLLLYRLFKGSFSDGKSSSWASLRDLRTLIVPAPLRGRVVVGRVKGKLIAAERNQSVILIGPTQSGKTSGCVIPAINEWEGPVLATSVKSDLLRHTIDGRSEKGDVWVYDPTESVPEEGSGWSPLASCGTWQGAQRTASWLCGAAPSGRAGLADAEFWYAAAGKLLAPLLYGAARSGRTITDVVRWVNLQEEKEVFAALKGGETGAMDAAKASFGRDIRQKSSIYTTAETVLAAYEDPVVAKSAQTCDISARSFLSEGSQKTLYVVAPSHEQQRLRPLFETLLHTVITAAFDLSNEMGAPLDPPLLVVLDEAANIAPLRDLDTLASTAASHGIQLVSVFQDLAQITTRYRERTQTVVNNHRGKVFMSGVSDTQTLEYASRLLGDEEVLQASVTRGAYGSRSTTESTALRSVAPASVLRGIRPGEGIFVYGHLPPTRLTLRPWFKEKGARNKTKAMSG